LQFSPSSVYDPAVGTKFLIIFNDGADAIVGTFKGLPEGSSLTTNGGKAFRISYHGGDGNDVVLTRITNTIVTGPDAGGPARVRVFEVAAPHAPKFDFLAYPRNFKGGVRVATADVNNDGFPDIVTAP